MKITIAARFSIEYEVDDETPDRADMTEKTTKAAKVALGSVTDAVLQVFVEESTENTGFLVRSANITF